MFVALYAPRLSQVQRHSSSSLRSVGCVRSRVRIETPPATRLTRVVNLEANRSEEMSARISERFAKEPSLAGQQAAS